MSARARRDGTALRVHAEDAVASAAVLIHASGAHAPVCFALVHEPLHVLHAGHRNYSELGHVRAAIGVRLHLQLRPATANKQVHKSFVVNL